MQMISGAAWLLVDRSRQWCYAITAGHTVGTSQGHNMACMHTHGCTCLPHRQLVNELSTAYLVSTFCRIQRPNHVGWSQEQPCLLSVLAVDGASMPETTCACKSQSCRMPGCLIEMQPYCSQIRSAQ